MVYASERSQEWLGSAVLIDEKRLLTCDHVAVGDELWVEFPKAEQDDERRYRVVSVVRAPPRYDLALLSLEDSPKVVRAPLRHTPPVGLVGHPWWAFGYPLGEVHGNDARGQVGIDLGRGFVRLDCRPGDRYVLKKGFSGSGVWSARYQAVVAIVVQAGGGDGKAVTLHRALSCFPEAKLDQLTTWSASDSDEVARTSWGLTKRSQASPNGWRLSEDPETARHWSPRARGVAVDSERGHRFQGRRRALTEIADWLDAEVPDHRVLVVTGSPGVGKSAVLGRIVTTADPALRDQLPDHDTGVRATTASVQCAVHAKGKTALEIATEIARAASAPLPERPADLAPALREELTEHPRRFTIIIDALDEAVTPKDVRTVVTEVLLPLAQTCADAGVRLVVGTRRHDDHGNLLQIFGPARTTIDLDEAAYFEVEDLTAYAQATLQLQGAERPNNPYNDSLIAAPVAARIATLAHRNFLVAGLVAKSHGLYDTTPIDPAELTFIGRVDNALGAYLARVPDIGGVTAVQVLTALAYAHAPGWSVSLWQIAVHAFTGIVLSEQELHAFARSSAANFLVESSQGHSYRLFHQALNDVLLHDRHEIVAANDDQTALTTAFHAYGRRLGWQKAPDYLLRSLPAHAAAGDILDSLFDDADFILHTETARVLAVKDHAHSRQARACIRLLELTPDARTAPPAKRLAMLALTEAMEDLGDIYQTLARSVGTPYRPVWSSCQPRQEIIRFEGHTDWVRAVCAYTTPDGQP
ncbi:serine protease, partial [Actinomadura parmotrematis]